MTRHTVIKNGSLVELRGLSTSVQTRRGEQVIVDDLNLKIGRGESVAIIGESGCGKSLTALSVMRLLPKGRARIRSGEVRLDGRDIARLPERDLAALRGRDIAMIFQDPMSALNPVMSIGKQIEEAIRAHSELKGKALRQRAIELLRLVHISDPEARLKDYPHRLSGGMCQRVAIAMAIACDPRLLIADEPTTALDVTIQAQVLQLLQSLKDQTGMSLLIITHDFGVVSEMADRVVVMYAGRKIEEGTLEQIFSDARHPYTRGLLALTLQPGQPRLDRLPEIAGVVPSYEARPAGCAFADRCDRVMDVCRRQVPATIEIAPEAGRASGHEVACWAAELESERYVVTVDQ